MDDDSDSGREVKHFDGCAVDGRMVNDRGAGLEGETEVFTENCPIPLYPPLIPQEYLPAFWNCIIKCNLYLHFIIALQRRGRLVCHLGFDACD
jgi:hypothetical protein